MPTILAPVLLVLSLLLVPRPAGAAVSVERLADQAVQLTRIVFDASGNRYAVGSVKGPGAVDVDPGPDVHPVAATGSTLEAVAVKYDADGHWVWGTTFGGSGDDVFLDVALADGTLYAVGRSTSVDAGFGGTGDVEVTTVQGGVLVAIDAASGAPRATFDGDGVVTFVPADPSKFFSDFASFNAVAVANGVVYVGGHYVHDATGFGFGGRPIVTPPNGVGDSEQGLLVAVNGTTGAPITSFAGDGIQFVGGQNDEVIHDVAVANGTLYFAGDAETPDVAIGGVDAGGTIDRPGYVGALDAATGLAKAGFGANGLALCGSASFCEAWRLVVDGATVYAAGRTGQGPVQAPGVAGVSTITGDANEIDDFVWALDAATGNAKTAFGGGLVVIGSPWDAMAQVGRDRSPFDLLLAQGTLYLAAIFRAASVGIGGAGSVEAGDSTVVALDPATGAARTSFSSDGFETVTGGSATDALDWTPGTLACDPTNGLTLAGDLADGKNLVLGSDAGTPLATSQGLYLVALGPACDAVPSDVEPPPSAAPAFFLPTKLKVKPNAKTPAKSRVTLEGIVDLGVDPVDLTKPGTLTVAGATLAFPGLERKGGKHLFRAAPTFLEIKTAKNGSSRATLKMLLRQDVTATVPLDGLTAIAFDDGDVAGTAGVRMAAGRFKLGAARGTLAAPPLYLMQASAALRGAGKDGFKLRAGLATDGTTPAALSDVTIYFGDLFVQKVPGAAFHRQKDKFTYKAPPTQAFGLKAVVVDFRKERIDVSAQRTTLGTFAAGPQPVLIGLRLGGDARAVKVLMASSGKKLKY